MFKVNNRSKKRSGVYIANFEHIWHVSHVVFFVVAVVVAAFGVFLLILNMKMLDGILCCLNLSSSMCFRVRPGSPVTFKMKLFVTTVNNCFQLFHIFFYKEFHLRCCIGPWTLDIAAWSTKILKSIEDTWQ